VLSTNHPTNVELPGQPKIFVQLATQSFGIDTGNPGGDDGPGDSVDQDVEFEPAGRPLNSLHYASYLTKKYEDELCNICQDNLWDGYEQEVSIDTCGHLVHEDCLSKLINGIDTWSNKCTVCRQEICPARARRALIEEEEEEEEEVDAYGDVEDDGDE
jgi:hypothetical protein